MLISGTPIGAGYSAEPSSTTAAISGDLQTIFAAQKILHHQDRLLEYLGDYRYLHQGSSPRRSQCVPITMELDLSNVCSHRCALCVGARFSESPREHNFPVAGDGEQIPTDRAADYLVQMAGAGVRAVIFTGGGEPTIHRELEYLMLLAKHLGMKVGLITHGGLLHTKCVPSLLLASEWIRVSVDASNEHEYEQAHGRGRREWDRVWKNISALVRSRANIRRDTCSPGPTVGVGFLSGPHNIVGLPDLVRRAYRSGVDYVQVRPYHSHLTFDATKHIAEVKRRFDNDSFRVIGSMQKYSRIRDGHVLPRNYTCCHIAQFASVICANEKMYLCCHYRNLEEYCLGSLREFSFEAILMSERRKVVERRVRVNECQPLCRGDHVNRTVQSVMDGELPRAASVPAPVHVDFL